MWYALHCSYMCYSFSVGLCERDLYQSKHFTFTQVLTKSHKRTVPPPVFLHQRIFSQASGMHRYRTSWSSLICEGFKAVLWMCDMPTHRKTMMPKQVSELTKSLSGFLSWWYSVRRGKSRIWSEKNTLESVVQSMKEKSLFFSQAVNEMLHNIISLSSLKNSKRQTGTRRRVGKTAVPDRTGSRSMTARLTHQIQPSVAEAQHVI